MLITTALIITNLACLIVYYFRRQRLPGEPPLVSHTIPYLGKAVEFGKNPIGFLREMQAKHGDVYSMEIAGWNYHVIMNPLDILNLGKCKTLRQDSVVGDFVTRMVGSHHSIHNPKLHDYDGVQRNKNVAKAMVENLRGSTQMQNLYDSTRQVTVDTIKLLLNEKIQIYEENDNVKLHELCKELIFYNTYNVLLGTLADEEENLKQAKAFKEQFRAFDEGTVWLIDRIPMYFLRKTKQAREEIFKIFRNINFKNRRNVSDIIEQVMNADQNQENRIRHLLIFMWTSQANTTPGLFWALFHILKNPQVQHQIMEEFKALLKSKSQETNLDDVNNNTPERKISLNDILNLEKNELNKLVLLDAILKETIRLNGHNTNVRMATEDTVFTTHDGKQYRFRKGDHVMYYSPVMHMDPEIFDKPEEFVYDRFLEKSHEELFSDASTTKMRPHFTKNGRRISLASSILTFGFGEGKCPGRHWAFMEIKLLILSLLTCFEPNLTTQETPQKDMSYVGFGVLPPNCDVTVNLAKRKA